MYTDTFNAYLKGLAQTKYFENTDLQEMYNITPSLFKKILKMDIVAQDFTHCFFNSSADLNTEITRLTSILNTTKMYVKGFNYMNPVYIIVCENLQEANRVRRKAIAATKKERVEMFAREAQEAKDAASAPVEAKFAKLEAKRQKLRVEAQQKKEEARKAMLT